MSQASNKAYLKCKDYSVSGEYFELLHDTDLDILETSPQPKEEQLGQYYESEDYISHTDSKRNLFEKAYHVVKGIALKRKLNLINSFNTDEKFLLDVGCGTGDFLQIAKTNGWQICGVEPDGGARNLACTKVGEVVYDASKINNLKPHSFDVITLWHVLEHLPNLDTHIKNYKKLLKPNGVLVIAVPNYKSYDAQYYKADWAAFDVPRHLWHFSQKGMSNILGKQEFKVVKTLPMIFDAFYVSLLSEKYKSGKMNFIKAFQIGLQSNLKAKQTGEYSSLIYVAKNK
ncbi:SAM-dependent methyltransferases [Formosa agariphila KMM 3901]|uniref:SAM-dependent methyltransferases n=1 Tax=Formosa agariphila (strain DSM 15362 / KCTC 12365 / LMG 23005 / KMM 3901 / M-2Alg 35-1) TaxID=1347342 RepID=T2KSD8_FORAG|nr:class I SAM-dependent methyltransferase [Formosa agariphila]CDF81244.1 SAM-dependent methyltransferases [Formosa agariphila KMM 3901]